MRIIKCLKQLKKLKRDSMKNEFDIKKRFHEVNSMSVNCHASKEIEGYLRGYSDALEWVLELR